MKGRIEGDRSRTGVHRALRLSGALSIVSVAGALALAGCGGEATPHTSNAGSGSSGQAQGAAIGARHGAGRTVVSVAGRPITRPTYEHWLHVERALGVHDDAAHRALAFLITSEWVVDEAAAKHVDVSEAQVSKRLEQLERQSFPKPGQLKRYLSKSEETMSDLRGRVRVELLESEIAQHVAARKPSAARKATLASYQRTFHNHWKGLTSCRPGYVMEDCRQYHGSGEPALASTPKGSSSAGSGGSSSARASGSGSPSAGSGSGGASNPTGEAYSRPGSLSLSSPAFERNGAIPAKYTCDGADVSPSLLWSNVPAKAAALVLFIIDDATSGPASGIRWVVGDIDPKTHGVAAGKVPAGGIVGADTQGKSGYGGICPAHGKTDTLEFVMYALKKRIPLKPGFQAATAEQEYGSTKDLLGESAVTYAVYHRP